MRLIAVISVLICMSSDGWGQDPTTTVSTATDVSSMKPLSTTTLDSGTSASSCPANCLLPLDYGVGRGKRPFMYYYFDAKKGCKKFHHTGRQGNANKFRTKEQCKKECEIDACGFVQSGEESKESDEKID